jgi:hypothetical protein
MFELVIEKFIFIFVIYEMRVLSYLHYADGNDENIHP